MWNRHLEELAPDPQLYLCTSEAKCKDVLKDDDADTLAREMGEPFRDKDEKIGVSDRNDDVATHEESLDLMIERVVEKQAEVAAAVKIQASMRRRLANKEVYTRRVLKRLQNLEADMKEVAKVSKDMVEIVRSACQNSSADNHVNPTPPLNEPWKT